MHLLTRWVTRCRRDTRDKRILSVWRGTNKGSQLWDQVFNSGMIDCPYDRSVKLIKYYRDAFGTVEKDFLQQLQSTMNQHKGWNLFFTVRLATPRPP